jgi:hypothetical protein
MLVIKDIHTPPRNILKCCSVTCSFHGSTRRKMSLDQQLSVPTPYVSNRSGGDIPCWRVPYTGHASAFKAISAPQHEQKAATSLHLHNCYDCLDERRKCNDSRPGSRYDSGPLFGRPIGSIVISSRKRTGHERRRSLFRKDHPPGLRLARTE